MSRAGRLSAGLGTLGALAVSPALTTLTGSPIAYGVVLLPWTLALWALTRTTPGAVGLRVGRPRAYVVALAYPVAVMAAVGLIALLAGRIGVREPAVGALALKVLVLFLVGAVGALVTEEGFFRGWLWGVLGEAGTGPRAVLVWTSGIFAAWHIGASLLVLGLSWARLPVYVANMFFVGLVLGLLRHTSGSILVPSVCHALWNAISYTLFGIGERPGALQLASRPLLDPEIGALGLVLNLGAVLLLWRALAPGRHGA
jgi:membrane protease YdiL (CAAX protease family)